MHGVLLVDDEPLVRAGLARKIDWERYGMRVVAEASNGDDALEKITSADLSLVITDIKMPGMDGLELIRRAGRARPELRFVVLSGYDEFDLAQEAMRLGVRHYLLKPTKPAELHRVLQDAAAEIRELEEEREVHSRMEERLARSLPMIREQFFRDLIMGRLYTGEELRSYLSYFAIADEPVALLLFAVPVPVPYQDILTLRWILERAGGEEAILLAAIVKDSLAILAPARSVEGLMGRMETVRARFRRLVGKPLTIALGGTGPLSAVAELYDRAVTYLRYRFHYGDDILITPQDVSAEPSRESTADLEYQKERAVLAVRCGDADGLDEALAALGEEMRDARRPREDVCSHMIELLLTVARAENYQNLRRYLDCAERVQAAGTIDEVGRLVRECCLPLVEANYSQLRSQRSLLVEKVVAGVESHLSNPELSLKWLAANLIYANVDYLSKAFKRETAENFNHYVTRCRMDRARRLLRESPGLPISEVARRVGFGESAQYFSRVFRGQTGLTPSQYRAGEERAAESAD